MSSDRQRSIAVRSYRDVVDVVERRIFRIDRWRIPHPGGVPAVALGYFVVAVAAILFALRLPLLGELLALMQPALRFIGIPAICAWALVSWQVDGRRPHHALVSALRHRLGARTLAGLRAVPAVGTRLAPLDGATIAPSGDEPRYRAGRVRGPATVVLRYPAEVRVEDRRGHPVVAPTLDAALPRGRRVRVRAMAGAARPLGVGELVEIPADGELVFE
jgi:hypothetical protein